MFSCWFGWLFGNRIVDVSLVVSCGLVEVFGLLVPVSSAPLWLVFPRLAYLPGGLAGDLHNLHVLPVLRGLVLYRVGWG